jgi:hypothetical protein
MDHQNLSAPSCAQVSPGNARDLRALLEATLEALTLPFDADDYDKRLVDRASWARATIEGAFQDDPADIGWNADYLRSKMAAEQADAEKRRVQQSVDAQFPTVAAFLAAENGEGQ